MKVVLDTNVLIDAFRDDYSYQKRIIDEVIAGRLQAFANHQTLRENRLLLNQLINSPDYERELNDFFSQISPVDNPHRIKIVEDPEDNKILESAVEAEADYLITSDNGLLKLKKFRDIEIITPPEFWARYSEDDKNNLWTQWMNYIKSS